MLPCERSWGEPLIVDRSQYRSYERELGLMARLKQEAETRSNRAESVPFAATRCYNRWR